VNKIVKIVLRGFSTTKSVRCNFVLLTLLRLCCQRSFMQRFHVTSQSVRCVRFDPLGSRSPPYERIKFGYPLENVRFLLLLTNLAREWLQIDTDLLRAYHNKHCWRAFRGYQHRWPWTTLNPQNMGFKWFFCYFRLRRTLRVNFRWNIMEIDQDNLRTKLNWCCGASYEH